MNEMILKLVTLAVVTCVLMGTSAAFFLSLGIMIGYSREKLPWLGRIFMSAPRWPVISKVILLLIFCPTTAGFVLALLTATFGFERRLLPVLAPILSFAFVLIACIEALYIKVRRSRYLMPHILAVAVSVALLWIGNTAADEMVHLKYIAITIATLWYPFAVLGVLKGLRKTNEGK